MNTFALYEVATGRILNVIRTPRDSVQTGGDHAVVAVGPDVDDSTHYIENGVPVTIPARPTSKHVWDSVQKSWRDTRTLEQAKTTKWLEIKAERLAAESAGFVWGGDTYHGDADSQRFILMAAQASKKSLVVPRKNKGTRLMSQQEVKSLATAMSDHVIGLHERAQQIRQRIESASSISEVDAIFWTP